MSETLAIVPARGGSKGLPGKNVRPLAGLPLLVHSLRLAAMCDEIGRTIVSTDSEEVAAVAAAAGGEIPFLRPLELARDDTPMLPVLQHALDEMDRAGQRYERLLLLDPTAPGRLPDDVARAHALLASRPEADGVVAVSEPGFNPLWHAVVERDGLIEPLFPESRSYARRQDVPRVLRINAAVYLWRTEFIRRERETWMNGQHVALEIPESRAFHIDSEEDFRLCELAIAAGIVRLPWLAA